MLPQNHISSGWDSNTPSTVLLAARKPYLTKHETKQRVSPSFFCIRARKWTCKDPRLPECLFYFIEWFLHRYIFGISTCASQQLCSYNSNMLEEISKWNQNLQSSDHLWHFLEQINKRDIHGWCFKVLSHLSHLLLLYVQEKGLYGVAPSMNFYIEWPECWYPDDSPWPWSGGWFGMGNCSWSGDDPTLEIQFLCTGPGTRLLSAVVMSWMLDLFLSFFPEVCRMKYFWAWLATWVGVLVTTTFLEMLLQSPFP